MSTVSPVQFLAGLRFDYQPDPKPPRSPGLFSCWSPPRRVLRFPTAHLAKKAYRLGITATHDHEATPWENIKPDSHKLFETPDDRSSHASKLGHEYLVQRAQNAITDIFEECTRQLVHLGDDSEEWYWCRVSTALMPQFRRAALTGGEVREIVRVFVRGRVRYLMEVKRRGSVGRYWVEVKGRRSFEGLVCGEVAEAVDRWVSALGGSVPMENSGLGELERYTTWLTVLQGTLEGHGVMNGVGGLGIFEDFFARAWGCLLGGDDEGIEGVTGLLVFSRPTEEAEDRRRYLGAALALRRLSSDDPKIVRIQPVLFFPWENYGRYLHPFWRDHTDAINTWRRQLLLKVEQWAVGASTESRTVMLRNGFVGGKWDYRAYRGGIFVNTNNEPDESDCWDDSEGDKEDRYFGPDSVSMCTSWMHALLTTMPPGTTVPKDKTSRCYEDDTEDDLLLPPGGSEEKVKKWMDDKGYQGVVEWGYRPDDLSEPEKEEVQEPAAASEDKSKEVERANDFGELGGGYYRLGSTNPSSSSTMFSRIRRHSEEPKGPFRARWQRTVQRLPRSELLHWEPILDEFHFDYDKPERLSESNDELWELD